MSKIVNNGIQQGNRNAIPKALRISKMEQLMAVLDEEEEQIVRGNYQLIDQNSLII